MYGIMGQRTDCVVFGKELKLLANLIFDRPSCQLTTTEDLMRKLGKRLLTYTELFEQRLNLRVI